MRSFEGKFDSVNVLNISHPLADIMLQTEAEDTGGKEEIVCD